MFWDSEIEYPLSAEPELTRPGGKQSSKIPELYTYFILKSLNYTLTSYKNSWTVLLLHAEIPELYSYFIQKSLNCTLTSYKNPWTVNLLHTEIPELYSYFIQKFLKCTLISYRNPWTVHLLHTTRGPQALTVTWVSETLHWLLVKRAHICISTAPS